MDDEPIVTDLLDLTEVPLSVLMSVDCPELDAACARLVEQLRQQPPSDGCC